MQGPVQLTMLSLLLIASLTVAETQLRFRHLVRVVTNSGFTGATKDSPHNTLRE